MAGMSVCVQMRLCIQGGDLGTDAWAPNDVRIIDGAPFVPLRSQDRMLAKFCGCKGAAPLAYNGFMSSLREARNEAVDRALLRVLNQTDAFGAVRKLPKGARNMVDPMEMAGYVTVELPAVSAMVAGDVMRASAITVKLALELNRNGICCIECTAEALNYLRVAIRGAERSQSTPRAFRAEKRRKVVYTAERTQTQNHTMTQTRLGRPMTQTRLHLRREDAKGGCVQ